MSPVQASFRQVVGEAIDRLSPPGSTLYMFGQTTGMYFAADRQPTSRFVNDDSLVGFYGGIFAKGYNSGPDRRELLADLHRAPPAVIMTGGSPGAQPALWPGFARFLSAQYVRVRAYGGYTLYTPRRESSGGSKGFKVQSSKGFAPKVFNWLLHLKSAGCTLIVAQYRAHAPPDSTHRCCDENLA